MSVGLGAGGGYCVDASSLRGFAQAAAGVGRSVEALAGTVRAALALGVPGGLDIGAAIERARGAWGTRLEQLAGEAERMSANLDANAASYDQAETAAHASLTRVIRGEVYAL